MNLGREKLFDRPRRSSSVANPINTPDSNTALHWWRPEENQASIRPPQTKHTHYQCNLWGVHHHRHKGRKSICTSVFLQTTQLFSSSFRRFHVFQICHSDSCNLQLPVDVAKYKNVIENEDEGQCSPQSRLRRQTCKQANSTLFSQVRFNRNHKKKITISKQLLLFFLFSLFWLSCFSFHPTASFLPS